MKNKNLFKNYKKLIISILILLTLFTKDVLAKADPLIIRIEGKNRMETSIAISREAFKEQANTAIIVGYHGQVDALTGSILAEKKKAPILISSKNELGDSIKAELKRLGTQEVFILGGSGVVDKEIERELKSLNLNVKRLNGASREETAIDIARESIDGEVREAFLSLGYKDYADALAIGPIAARKNMPLLLTKSKDLSESTLDYIDNSNIKKVNIIGGENAVSKEVEKALRDRGIRVDRIKGNSREETAISIAKAYVKDPEKLFLANGYQYTDAVVGGYLAAKENIPIILTNGKKINKANLAYIKEKGLDISILGGKASIDDNVIKSIKISLGLIKEELPVEKEPPVKVDPPKDIEPIVKGKEIKSFAELKQFIDSELDKSATKINIKYTGKTTLNELYDKVNDILKEYIDSGSYIAGNIIKRKYTVATGGYYNSTVDIEIEYTSSKEQEAFIDKEVSRIVKDIIKPGMSEFEKVKTIHDYIINNTVYSEKTKTSPHSAYTLLKEGKGVCQAYALAANKFFDAVGIESYYVTGRAGGENHAWNKLKVDGKWYNIDTTWDDPVAWDGEDYLLYDFFLITDAKLGKTHKPDHNKFPRATDKKYELLSDFFLEENMASGY